MMLASRRARAVVAGMTEVVDTLLQLHGPRAFTDTSR
jgi:hypothetical protein